MREIADTYFYLYENPSQRQLGFCGEKILHQTSQFNVNTYSAEIGRNFDSNEDAYDHWLSIGRQQGLRYASQRNTMLKIVLKAKDEPELIEKWIAHHSSIVGPENIIIMDCGSTDPIYLKILDKYRKDILVFDYRKYYDHLHSTWSNKNFFTLLQKNCRYLTILDADEFLVACKDGVFSGANVLPMLRNSTDAVFAGTWVNNLHPIGDDSGVIDWNKTIALTASRSDLIAGTVAGKAIVRSDLIFDVKHLGHNLHVKEVMQHMTPASFGKLVVFHLKAMHPKLIRKRIEKHLRSKNLLPSNVQGDNAIEQHLRILSDRIGGIPAHAFGYVKKYLSTCGSLAPVISDKIENTCLLGRAGFEKLPVLQGALKDIDFGGLLDKYRH